MQAALESLLRARKLDVTLTSAAGRTDAPPARFAPTGIAALDAALAGGLRRGHLSEGIGVARIVEGSDPVALLVAGERVARSPAGVTIALESPAGARWSGTGPRARVFRGLATSPRIVRAH